MREDILLCDINEMWLEHKGLYEVQWTEFMLKGDPNKWNTFPVGVAVVSVREPYRDKGRRYVFKWLFRDKDHFDDDNYVLQTGDMICANFSFEKIKPEDVPGYMASPLTRMPFFEEFIKNV